MFSSIEDVIERFAKNNYIASRRIATVIYLASEMRKPILVEGPAGVGKTDLAKVLAASLGFEMIRLQCYEGLDEGKALYEWEYAKQLLYTQILKDKISEVLVGAKGLTEAVRAAARDLRAAGVQSIAVCFLFSFLNPANEARAKALAR